jgi:hypothetical protein
MSNANVIVKKGENNYSDLTDQEVNPHIQYVERPMIAPLESWMTTNAPPHSTVNMQQTSYYNTNENGSLLPTPPTSNNPGQLQKQQRISMENGFTSHEFMANGSNVPVNYHQYHQVYSPSPSPPRYRQGSIASDSSNPSTTPYGELDEPSSQFSRNHAGGEGGGGTSGGTKLTVNKRNKALERNRQGKN